MTDDWVTAPAQEQHDDWVTHEPAKPPVPGSTPTTALDDTEHAASPATIARASLPPDEKVQLKRYAEAFKQPVTDFGVIDGHVVRRVPETGQYARVQPSVRGSTGPLDAAERAFDWVAGGAGQALPALGSAVGMAAAGILATPETAGAGTIPAAMAGGAAGASLGEIARQKLDAALAPKGSEVPLDVGNVAWQGAAGAAGPLVGKAIEAAAPGVTSLLTKGGAAAAGLDAGTADATSLLTKGISPGAAMGADSVAAPVAEETSAKVLGLSPAAMAALERQAAQHRTELEQLEKDINSFKEAGVPVDLSLGQKTGEWNLRQKERQLIRDPSTVNDVMNLRELQNKTQIPGAVRSVLDDIAPDTGQEAAIGSFRTGADAVIAAAEKNRAELADPLYKQAFASNRSVSSPKLDELMDTPEGKDAFKYAIRRMQNRMRNAGVNDPELAEQVRLLVDRGEMKSPTGGVASGLKLETLDLIKQGLWDSEDALRKQVVNGTARQGEVDEISSIRRAFTNELDRLDVTASEQAQGLPINDMKAAMRKAGKLPPSHVDTILADVDSMIKDAGGAKEALDTYVFPKGQEDWYKAALSVAEDHAAGPPTTGGNGIGLYKQARQAFGDPSDDIDAMKEGGIGFIQRMKGQDRQGIVNRVFQGGNLLPEEVARMREQFAVAGKLNDWHAGVRSFIEDHLADAMKSTRTSDLSNVGGKMYENFWGSPKQAAVMKAALGGDGGAVMRRWESLGRVMEAAARQLAEGSPSITDLPILSRIGLGLKMIFKPQNIPGEVLDKIDNFRNADAAQQFAKYALTPEGDKILRTLYLQTPSSPKAQSLLAKMLVQAGVVDAVDEVRQH